MTYVFRNHTIERFLQGEYIFSGYDDYSSVPEASEYIWWYQLPMGFDVDVQLSLVESYKQRLQYVVSHVDGRLLHIFTLSPICMPAIVASDRRVEEAVCAFNAYVRALCAENAHCKVVDIGAFLSQYSAAERIDWRFYFMSQMPINPRLSGAFAQWYARERAMLANRRKKCLVVDLDNTLWGGIIGEDGVAHVALGGDYPGKAFHAWQEALLCLKRSGVLLAICSKNNAADVDALWAQRGSEMVLKPTDFASSRINWEDKETNIASIAQELNIGTDSIVFVDDNPSERARVRGCMPDVSVPEWSGQPYDLMRLYGEMVAQYFSVEALTEEDKQKTEQYRQNAARMAEQRQYTSVEEFVASLQIELQVRLLTPEDVPAIVRSAQMSQKTNQFNLTTKRYVEADIRRLIEGGSRVYTLSVRDRFGDYGIAGLCIVCPTEEGEEIDTMLMSCRVLGKGIEKAFGQHVLHLLQESGCTHLAARYVPTAKNGQTATYYEQIGMRALSETAADATAEKRYACDLTTWQYTPNEAYTIR